jgi:hypothetical protein
MPDRRLLGALATATLAALAAAGGAAAAQPPRDCLTAWNRSAPKALRDDVQRATRVQLSRANDWGSGSCMLLYVGRSGTLKLAYGTRIAGPDGQAGVWTAARALVSLGPKPACIRNVRVLRGGTLLPL